MLVAGAADRASVISRSLGLVSFLCCLLVALSFALFARDQAAGASDHQQAEQGVLVASATGATRAHVHAQPRRFIDGAAGVLTSPFTAVVPSRNAWVKHGVPTLLGLLAYGIGLSFLGRCIRV
jgi:hypothetical protein